ncbi:polysaccharide lyase family 8 super-sandwich domain-containing protein [Nonomuraea guangzhouensis]|uniref:Polysaccharide lyase family 8 super-sandwich domain-containing protein n=1 Tax=Nonomuraea guangzhouensis TaxID=1291555 RepID=A0ABW4GNY7_9ACTN|nr:polysaccharide lyase family 8 super-sandwich domain-containing protein [Nonomuraea guangzhouensis]
MPNPEPALETALATARARLLHELLDSASGTTAIGAASGLAGPSPLADGPGADGTWPDLDYADRGDGRNWAPLEHLSRTLTLALSEPHRPTALPALDAWRRHAPRSANWWYNEIAAPQLAGDALLLLADRLGPAERAAWGAWLAGCAGPGEMTGQNLVWTQAVVLRHGLLVNDAGLVASAVARMSTTLRATRGEGIQDDFSFHQHGAQLYSGGYGFALAADLGLWIYVVYGTPWAFGRAEVGFFTDFLLDGLQWAMHGGVFDFTTMGRNITRADAHRPTADLRTAIRRLRAAGAPRQDELAAFERHLAEAEAGRAAAGPVGCRYYPRSDYLVHRRPGWSVSVRMSSSRTAPTESMNGENLRGRHLGDGVAPIRIGDGPQDGYRAVIPLWDWARLPGVTAEQPPGPAALLPRPNDRHGASPDVGGWTDGRHGIAVMRLAGTDRIADGWKAWFCFDDVFVALGAGITAPSAAHPVVTTIDQRLAAGPVTTGRYAHHGRIGYVPLSDREPTGQAAGRPASELWTRVERRTGSWSDITATGSTEPLTARVFAVGFDHGPRPDGATYACLVLPGADAAATDARWADPGVTVLSNTPLLQAVHCERSGITLTARHDGHGLVFTVGS